MDRKRNKVHEAEEFDNIKDMLANTVKKHGENYAFILKSKKDGKVEYQNITYKQFQDDVNAFGTSLIERGLKDKRIAVISKNRYEWMLTYLSTINGAGISVPLDKGLPEGEIEFSLKKSKADCVVFGSEHLEIMKKFQKNKVTNVTQFICMDDIDGLDEKQGFTTLKKCVEQGKKLLEKGDRRFLDAPIDPEEMRIILFTSGTTSRAKAVMLSHKNLASNIYGISRADRMFSTDVNMAFLPFHHTFGSTGLLLFLSVGATNVFCDGIRHIQENLKEYGVSVFISVPLLLETMYKKIKKQIVKQGKEKVVKIAIPITRTLRKMKIDIRRKVFKDIIDNLGGKLRFIVSGASHLDPKVEKGFNDFGILTLQGYGLTETSPVLAAENMYSIKYGSIGFPLCNVEMKVHEPNEKGIGEIIAKGPNVMLGYYEDKKTTNEVIKNGWFHTGDLGFKDKDGYFHITGRKKNVIVLKNGKNIYPEEIETLVNELPYVSESLVFGMPKDDDLVVSVKVVYNKEYVEENMPDLCNEKDKLYDKIWKDIKDINSKLTNYKHMKKLIITDEEMIKTTTAKIKRHEEIKKIMAES